MTVTINKPPCDYFIPHELISSTFLFLARGSRMHRHAETHEFQEVSLFLNNSPAQSAQALVANEFFTSYQKLWLMKCHHDCGYLLIHNFHSDSQGASLYDLNSSTFVCQWQLLLTLGDSDFTH